jgi:hypothetical protein
MISYVLDIIYAGPYMIIDIIIDIMISRDISYMQNHDFIDAMLNTDFI